MTRRNAKFLPGALMALALAVPGAAYAQADTSRSPQTSDQAPSAAGQPGARSDSGAEQRAESQLSRGDRKFLEKAAKDGMAEVELGQIAAQKASSDQVRQFAQQMVQEHTRANEQLQSIAQSQGLTLPTELDRSHRRDIEKLQKLSGAEFDKEYMERMVDDHQKDVKLFRKQAEDGEHPQLKQFAADTLPGLEHHLSMAKQTEEVAKAQAEGEEERGAAGRRGAEAESESGAASPSSPASPSGGKQPGGY